MASLVAEHRRPSNSGNGIVSGEVAPLLIRCTEATITEQEEPHTEGDDCERQQAGNAVYEAQAYSFRSMSQENQPGRESTMGEESIYEWAVVAVKPKRTISAAARRKIAAFQRARWAKVKAQQKKAA
jgi:hypothetical protein